MEKEKKMYRQYESPKAIRRMIEEVKAKMETERDEDRLYDLYQDLEELQERENFAWQDLYEGE